MNVKAALTRKYGPLPAWAWLLLLGVGVYYYRRKFSAVSSGTGTGSVTPNTPTPGTGEQVLQPGESVYDPTAGTLATAPGGDTGGAQAGNMTNYPDLSGFTSAIDALAGALGQAGQDGQTNATGGGNSTQHGHKKAPKLGKGGIRAPFGHNKPTKAPKGYTVKGQGHGFWEFVPKAKAKAKGQSSKAKAISTSSWKRDKSAPRSNASQRKATGGRTSNANKGKATVKPNASHAMTAKPAASRVRQPTRTPAVTATVRQRAQATQPKQLTPAQVQYINAGMAGASRPSAPPPRTVRAPAPPPPKKAAPAKKRK